MSAAARAVYLVCMVYLVPLVEQNQINKKDQKDQMNQTPATRNGSCISPVVLICQCSRLTTNPSFLLGALIKVPAPRAISSSLPLSRQLYLYCHPLWISPSQCISLCFKVETGFDFFDQKPRSSGFAIRSTIRKEYIWPSMARVHNDRSNGRCIN